MHSSLVVNCLSRYGFFLQCGAVFRNSASTHSGILVLAQPHLTALNRKILESISRTAPHRQATIRTAPHRLIKMHNTHLRTAPHRKARIRAAPHRLIKIHNTHLRTAPHRRGRCEFVEQAFLTVRVDLSRRPNRGFTAHP